MSTARGVARDLVRTFRLLNVEQRIAAIASLLLIASTFGPFSFIEAAEVVTALAVLTLVYLRANGRAFHLPLGDGTAIAAAGVWAGLLIVVRLFDRSLGQNLLALACAALLTFAGLSERAKRPMDDLPPEPARDADAARAASRARRRARRKTLPAPPPPKAPPEEPTERLWQDPAHPGPPPEPPLAPPEFELPGAAGDAEEEAPPEEPPTSQMSLEDDPLDAAEERPEQLPHRGRDEPTRWLHESDDDRARRLRDSGDDQTRRLR